ncbi:ferritin family protein [Alsobacter sp. SYSU M60028]|uniref:Ferritin family protein n=1 Tax=Alsobacter ponti TaxID=2962936 RepID=A0ABT1L7J9_9HYPH|nr:ferritin family protein [Alsobacter ponti]MCP8937402.1 ferritin family protein [Alsobacter ponti]
MSTLKSEPAGIVQSLDELFALAHEMESAAAEMYGQFALSMRSQGHGELADVFERIAAEEMSHVESVDKWSQRQSGHLPDPTRLVWAGPPPFDEEDAAEVAGSRMLTPYRILSIAVKNEERAFAFWSYVAAAAPREDVRLAAEAMATEELGHVAAFRRERRKAFHAARTKPGAASSAGDAADLEVHLAAMLAGTAFDADRARMDIVRKQTLSMADLARGLGTPVQLDTDAGPAALSEALAEAYLAAADRADDEDALARYQQLAERAVARLVAIRTLAK